MPDKPAPEHLLMLSGGLDSAWCLNHYLSQGIPLRTHHVRLNDWEGRADVEDRAVERILDWAAQQGWSHLITHTRSEVNFGDLRWIPYNYHLWAYWAGTIMASPAGKSITKIVIPRHSDAFDNAAAPEKSNHAYRTHVRTMSGRTPELVYPMIHLAKADIVRTIPDELREAAWWCRRPVNGKPCHKCKTCKQVDEGLRQMDSS